jgi:hypothetical protein
MPGGFNSSAIKSDLSKNLGLDPLVLTAFFFSEPLSSLPGDLLLKWKGKVGLTK